MSRYDAVVVGAGVFGAWIANLLARSGRQTLLVDQYGAAHARASSGGESRLIRMGYGEDAIYTRMAVASLAAWKDLFARTGRALFHRTGLLWMARNQDPRIAATERTLTAAGVPFEKMGRRELESRYPQMRFEGIDWGLLEPESGALMARQAVRAVVDDFLAVGGEFRIERAEFPCQVAARLTVYACGPWLPKVFPELLGGRIFPTRQEVFFFGTPPGDRRYAAPELPGWIEPGDLYGFPDLEWRGFKVACDRHGPGFDPDFGDRTIQVQAIAAMRKRLAGVFPALADAPLVETRVCQYENTSNGDFLLERHPDDPNVWICGGGSGHGFKHGPAVADYVLGRIEGRLAEEARFGWSTKGAVQRRLVY